VVVGEFSPGTVLLFAAALPVFPVFSPGEIPAVSEAGRRGYAHTPAKNATTTRTKTARTIKPAAKTRIIV
jgi:hypothetical protein